MAGGLVMASKYSPSLAKNMMRRSLRAVVDPHPSDEEVAEVRRFFGGLCAYCGTSVALGAKDMHLDHLESETTGGSNHISNRVPSCATCNEKEKRELPWLRFLDRKAASPEVRETRKKKILAWISRFSSDAGRLGDELRGRVGEEIGKAVAAYDLALEHLRSMRASRT
jgi:5-methylcytosine-specific restriction endonuclease McrA